MERLGGGRSTKFAPLLLVGSGAAVCILKFSAPGAALQTRAAAFAAMRVWPLEHYFCAPMKIVALLRA